MASVYMMQRDGTTDAMTRIRCKDEDLELQRILEANADLLPGDQINPADPRRWLQIKREMPVPSPDTGVGRWSIDFLFSDQDAIPTFVECKRFNDTRSRREVVGQMLEYAANGHHYWSGSELRDLAAETATKAGTTLERRLSDLQTADQLSPEAYFDRLQQNLREGQLRIVFFLEEAPQELKSVVDFLNRQMERSEVLLVEARQYLTAGTRIVVPTLFGYTEEARLVKRSVTVTTASARRKWDRDAFLDDTISRLGMEAAQVVERLLNHIIDLNCDVSWGTGMQFGSFSVKEPTICQRSLATCYSNGELYFNYQWLSGSPDAERANRRLK